MVSRMRSLANALSLIALIVPDSEFATLKTIEIGFSGIEIQCPGRVFKAFCVDTINHVQHNIEAHSQDDRKQDTKAPSKHRILPKSCK